jgi:glycerate kinase
MSCRDGRRTADWYSFGRVDFPTTLIASDKFKGTLSSLEVGECLAAGIRATVPDAPVTVLPVADGGDGTLDVAVAAGFRSVPIVAADPLGRRGEATIAISESLPTAVVELAEICGLRRLPVGELHPETSTSLGVGLAIRAALDLGMTDIVVGLGGSASTDGGAGLLHALGARFSDAAGRDVPPLTTRLSDIEVVDLSGVDHRLTAATLRAATDVTAPLLGPSGAAAVFGPQKGATPAEVARLERGLAVFSGAVRRANTSADPRVPGAGAAGGVGFGLLALGASVENGARLCLDLVGFESRLGSAGLVVTGEGRLDRQTLMGKAPALVAERARRRGVAVAAVVGSVASELDPDDLARLGFAAVFQLVEESPDVATSVPAARSALHAIGARLPVTLRGLARRTP